MILGDLLACLTQSPATFHEITDADKGINSLHFLFRSDPSDSRIQISPKIWIQIPDHFWLRLYAKLPQSHYSTEVHRFDDKRGSKLKGSCPLGASGGRRRVQAFLTTTTSTTLFD